MKRNINKLLQRRVSEITVEELITIIQGSVMEVVFPRQQNIPAEIISTDENLSFIINHHPENFAIGMKALAQLIGCSVRKTYDLRQTGIFDDATFTCGKRLVFNKAMVLDAYAQQGMYLKGRRLKNKIKEHKALRG